MMTDFEKKMFIRCFTAVSHAFGTLRDCLEETSSQEILDIQDKLRNDIILIWLGFRRKHNIKY